MSEKPILFSGPMIRALLAGRKTQTRRTLKPQPLRPVSVGGYWFDADDEYQDRPILRTVPGDRMWARETYQIEPTGDGRVRVHYPADDSDIHIDHTGKPDLIKQADRLWTEPDVCRPSIHMPRWASRITLEVTDVRVQRLQDISPDDCEAEGIEAFGPDVVVYRDNAATNPEAARRWDAFRIREYRKIWETINGAGSWAANPWVVAYTFTPSGKQALEASNG